MVDGERPIMYRGVVRNEQCDHMGHMNVMWYVGKFDEATWQLFASLGMSRSRMQKDNRGLVAVEQHIEYKRELRAGDVVTVRSTMVEAKGKVVRFTHEMGPARLLRLRIWSEFTSILSLENPMCCPPIFVNARSE